MPTLSRRRDRNIAMFTLALIITSSVYILFYGWGLKKGIFNPAISGNLPIAIDSAYCFILISLSFLFSVNYTSRVSVVISRVLSAMVFAWGTMLIIDSLAFIELPLIFGMSPQTALCFNLLAASFFFINTVKRKIVIQCLLHMVTFVASIVIIGHTFKLPELYRMGFVPMALYSAIGFLLLSVTASYIHRKVGITGLFTGKLIGNMMARRLFLKILIATLGIGYLRLLSHRNGWISPELGIALLTVTFLIISLILIWNTSNMLNTIDRKRKMAEENFRTAVEAAPYSLIISDRGGIIRMINKKTAILYGYKKKELIGRNIKLLLPDELHDTYDTIRKKFYAYPARPQTVGSNEVFARRKSGSEFPAELLLTPVKTSVDTFTLTTVIDITLRKAQEEIIKKQVTELQQKNEELEQFNYISSHDLQEPLRTVANYINLLEEDYGDQLDGDIKIHLATMGAAIGRMAGVVRSLLEFGKLGRNRKLVSTNSHLILGHVMADLGNLIKSKNAQIITECNLPEFYAYETELRQLFQNLINNAIKFTKEGTMPCIRIACREEDGYFRFSVSDNGIGIRKEHANKIFHIFQKLNSEDEFEGHGIGLANCKKIAEMHGGKIWVESEPGKGSTFIFTILNFKS